jgi:hypothetical protein
MRTFPALLPALLPGLFAACGTPPAPAPGSGTSDTASSSDATTVTDAAQTEIPGDATPAATQDASADSAQTIPSGSTAWGKVSGACGTGWLKAALADPQPSFHVSAYQFASGGGPFDPKPLRPLAYKRRNGPNAGGSSNCSEAMSIQTICDCEGAKPLKTELEIVWTQKGPTTDWSGELDGVKFGVSVSRIYLGPTVTAYTAADAKKLLEKKLAGINESSTLVAPADKWKKQILHLWTLRPEWIATVKSTWEGLDAKLKADTAILVTVEQGSEHIVKETCKP